MYFNGDSQKLRCSFQVYRVLQATESRCIIQSFIHGLMQDTQITSAVHRAELHEINSNHCLICHIQQHYKTHGKGYTTLKGA